MSTLNRKVRILAVVGSLNQHSVTRAVLKHTAEELQKQGCEVDLLDFIQEPLALFNPDSAYSGDSYERLKSRVEHADVYILGTPDYHGSMSSTIKNFLDHFWQEFAGKLFATLVSSHEKGLTVTDQLRTVARQCYAWSLPYGMSLAEKVDVQDGKIVNPAFQSRLDMWVHDIRVYGGLLAAQRERDLNGSEPGFMARLRKQPSPK
ncbi:MAG TPA: NAD(P)H-dependent oxidoreductase [Methylomirabilota bacterium]|nr:NAD(P)H-dependent oxidoreductase [Methylomirabilota bacterium]